MRKGEGFADGKYFDYFFSTNLSLKIKCAAREDSTAYLGMFCILCKSTQHCLSLHTFSRKQEWLQQQSQSETKRKWERILSWPLNDPQLSIYKPDWYQLKKTMNESYRNKLLINEAVIRLNSAMELVDDLPSYPPRRKKTVLLLEFLSEAAGISKEIIRGRAHPDLQRTLSWSVHETIWICAGKMIVGLIHPQHNPHKCDRFLWSPVTPANFIWYHSDTVEPRWWVRIYRISDDLFLISHISQRSNSHLYRAFDGVEIYLLDEKNQPIDCEQEYMYVNDQQDRLSACSFADPPYDDPNISDILHYDLISITTAAQNRHPLLSCTRFTDPYMMWSDMAEYEIVNHKNQQYWFRHRFSNHQHVSFWDNQNHLLKAWHQADLCVGPCGSRILLLRYGPDVLDFDADNTFQWRPREEEVRVNNQLEAWEFDFNCRWICKWKHQLPNVEWENDRFGWVNPTTVAIKRYDEKGEGIGLSIVDFETAQCLKNLDISGSFECRSVPLRPPHKFLAQLFYVVAFRELSQIIIPSLAHVVLSFE